jgi:multiple sugar transport system substrate-binding protein
MGDEISMNSKSEHPDQAWEFMKWYVTDGIKYMAKGGRFALANTVSTDEQMKIFITGSEKLIDEDSMKNVLFAQDTKPLTIPTITTKSPEIYKALNEELEAAMNGKKTAQQAMDDANKRANDFLAQQ